MTGNDDTRDDDRKPSPRGGGAAEPCRLPDSVLDDLQARAAQTFALQDHGRFSDYVTARAHMLAACTAETVLLLTGEARACRRREAAAAAS